MNAKHGLLAGLTLLAVVGRGATMDDGRGYVAWMRRTLPDVPTWDQWQGQTGELPPDFAALRSSNRLPDPLLSDAGQRVDSAAAWPARREEILRDFQKFVTGSFPAHTPLGPVEVLSEKPVEGGTVRRLLLHFGPGAKGSLHVEVALPAGAGPFPVLIHPSLVGTGPVGGWEPILLQRGYVSVAYAGGDFMDDTATLGELYPANDFAALPRRAWVAGYVVDYLETLPEVNRRQIALFGYSRDGKMAAMAAALEPRISALVAGSTGVGGFLPWRTQGERGMGEGIETTTRMFPTWFVPRLRFFSGHEDRLPVDANSLLALVAPRPCLIEYGLNDEVSAGWGLEQVCASVRPVYRLLGREGGVDLIRLPGFHGGNDQERYVDWLDIQFGRSAGKWSYEPLFDWDFAAWRRAGGETVDWSRFPEVPDGLQASSAADWETQRSRLIGSIDWMLGEHRPWASGYESWNDLIRHFIDKGPILGPVEAAGTGPANPGQLKPDVPAWVIARGGLDFGWLEPDRNEVASRKVNFGANLTGDLFYPAHLAAEAKLPTVVWLHGFSYPLGYMWVYRRDLHPILALVKAGYAVFAFDQSGFGSRMAEGAQFYSRFPHWSQLGQMVEDTRAAIDALAKDPAIDANRIGLFGYTVGGTVALYAAALDTRVKCSVSVCGFTPMRTDTLVHNLTGLGRYYDERGLLPRLGLFQDHEKQLPFDFDGVLAAIAPRSVLVVQPAMDRDAIPADVEHAVAQARAIFQLYHVPDNLGLQEPEDYARLTAATQDSAIQWVRRHLE